MTVSSTRQLGSRFPRQNSRSWLVIPAFHASVLVRIETKASCYGIRLRPSDSSDMRGRACMCCTPKSPNSTLCNIESPINQYQNSTGRSITIASNCEGITPHDAHDQLQHHIRIISRVGENTKKRIPSSRAKKRQNTLELYVSPAEFADLEAATSFITLALAGLTRCKLLSDYAPNVNM